MQDIDSTGRKMSEVVVQVQGRLARQGYEVKMVGIRRDGVQTRCLAEAT